MRRAPGTGTVYRPKYKTPAGELREARLYWIGWRDAAGKPHREAAKTANRQDAERLLRLKLGAADRGELPATRATWDVLAELIRKDYENRGLKSARRLEVSLAHLGKTFAGQRADSINNARLTSYVELRLEEGAARATVNREVSALKRAFKLAHRAGKVAAVPYAEKLDEKNARTGFFERADFLRLLRALPDDLKAAALAAYTTGWRMTSELLTRQRGPHLDLRRGWLRLEPNETKNGKGRMFSLTPELRAALRAQDRTTTALERELGRVIPWIFHHAGEPLFYVAKKGGLLPSAYLRESWAAACVKARVVGRIRHDFRRTAARDLMRAGVSVPTTLKAMGWESEAMLRRYVIVEEADLVDAGKRRAKLR